MNVIICLTVKHLEENVLCSKNRKVEQMVYVSRGCGDGTDSSEGALSDGELCGHEDEALLALHLDIASFPEASSHLICLAHFSSLSCSSGFGINTFVMVRSSFQESVRRLLGKCAEC